ncbi:hypothetical protein GQ53DRAFT_228039 [Thozetella sp. PMI_491]|nr:hypothetical protein GQ53DRAFT_228039 [Thozetella sp. PMI_491]
MRTTTCLFSSATALRRVFFQSTRELQWQPLRPFIPAFPTGINLQIRTYGKGTPKPNSASTRPVKRFPRDEAITSLFVILRSPDGTLSDPQRTRALLESLDRQRESLVVIAVPDRKTLAEGGEPPFKWPICKIADLQEERRKEQEELEKQKAARKLAIRTKEIELNWAIAPNDLRTRLRQLKSFLEKGLRVQILLMNKTGRDKKKRATKEEAAEVLELVQQTIAEVPGTKEYKPTQGSLGAQLRLFIDGPAPKKDIGEAAGPAESAAVQESTQ